MKPERPNVGADAFGPQASAITVVQYQANVSAAKSLRRVLDDVSGIGVLHGPAGSGKTVVVKQLAETLREQTVVIVLNGHSKTPRQIVLSLLQELGCNVQLQSIEELLKLAHVIGIHRVRTSLPPVLFVENIERMNPSGLQTLCVLAGFTTSDRAAIRLILTGRDECIAVLKSQEMADIATRTSRVVALGPMTSREVMNYLHARLASVGVERPDSILPLDACEFLFEQSAGWPQKLNDCAQQLIESAETFPVRIPDSAQDTIVNTVDSAEYLEPEESATLTPTLTVSKSGQIISQKAISGTKLLIGRSELADVLLDDHYVSKFHAMLLFRDDSVVMVDLNSSNGTFVNSRKVTTAALRDSDVLSIGHYRIKVENIAASILDTANRKSLSVTAKMKTLADQRAHRQDQAMLSLFEDEKEA